MKVSVCIPVYGVEKYIERCARSLFEQTMREDIEFIFVDDCTPDKSIDILEQILEEYPARKTQVKIIRHASNKGVTGSRKTALENSTGDYIIFCDSDDWLDKNLYNAMYNNAISNHADMVCCPIALEYHNRTLKQELSALSADAFFREYFNSVMFNSLCNKMVLRSIAIPAHRTIPNEITMAEDLLLVTKMLLQCRILSIHNEHYYHYFYYNPASSTLNFSLRSFNAARKAAEILYGILPEKYSELILALQGQILFSALRIPEITWKEYCGIYTLSTRCKVLLCRKLSLMKKIFLFISLFSVPAAQLSCRWAIKTANKLRMGK